MKYKLGDIVSIQQGFVPVADRYWLLNLDMIESNTGRIIDYLYVGEDEIGTSTICFDKSNVLYSKLRPYLNKVVLPTIEGYATSELLPLRPRTELITREYLTYFLRSKSFVEYINEKTNGAKMPRANTTDLKAVEIDCPSIEVQERITEQIDRIVSIINKRKQELEKFDELIKARFVEMFGDYDLSNAQVDWKAIFEIGKVIGGATPKTNVDEYWDGECRWITPAELSADSGYIYDSVRKLTKAGVDSCSLQEIPIDTVILSSRAPIGKVAIAGNIFYCNQGFKNIICNHEILPRYLYTVLLLNTEYLNSLGRGATFKEISKSIVESIRIPVPSIELQNQFVAFVNQVDKSKVAVQKSLEETQLLFDSLMQKYFG